MLFAISDLHFMQARAAVSARSWKGRVRRLKNSWVRSVGENDLVILAGDIIAASSPEAAGPALRWLNRLPGKKLILPGNHDRWWTTRLPDTLIPYSRGVQLHEDMCVVSIVGSHCPGSAGYAQPNGHHIYVRETARLKQRLTTAITTNKKAIVVAMHYPPFNMLRAENRFTELLEEHGVSLCIYGHLHGFALRRSYDGRLGNVEYRCVSSEKVGYRPVRCEVNTLCAKTSLVNFSI